MFRVEKGMVLIIVVVEAFDVSGIEEREQRAKISDPTMARAVRLPDMIWKTRAGAELDPLTSMSVAKNGGFSGTQDMILCLEYILLLETPCPFVGPSRFYPQGDNALTVTKVTGCSQTVAVAWLNQSSSAVAWVTQPERPKGVKDVIKQARRAAA